MFDDTGIYASGRGLAV
ncbi:hypothetical protein MLT81_24060 [Escherichia coli]|nr:hypothetical protein [Escherichia coli]